MTPLPHVTEQDEVLDQSDHAPFTDTQNKNNFKDSLFCRHLKKHNHAETISFSIRKKE